MKAVKSGKRLLLAGALGVAMAAGSLQAEEVQTGGELNVVTVYRTLDAVTWDPATWNWKNSHDGLFFDHLLRGNLEYGPRGQNVNNFTHQAFIPYEQLEGDLAESWEVKEDPLQIIFHLRDDVYWPAREGLMERRKLVASDVTNHFEKIWQSERRVPEFYDFIDKFEAKDDRTVVLHLNQWHSNWHYRLAWGYFDGIAPPEWHALDPEGRGDWKNATGTGAYKLTSVERGSAQVYERNDDHWDTVELNGKTYDLPLNDKVTYRIIKDESSAIAALRSGRVDIMEAIRWQFVDELKRGAPELVWREAVESSGHYMSLRNDIAPFNDVRVRRAMNLAVDQRAILEGLLDGRGVLLEYPMSSNQTGYYTPVEELRDGGKELFDYNPDRARELLKEAGHDKGLTFRVQVFSGNPYHMDLVNMLEAYYSAVGIKMEVQAMEYGAYRSMMGHENQAPGYMISNGAGNPLQVIRKSFLGGQTWNPDRHADTFVDEQINEAIKERDPEVQQRILRDLNRYIIEERVPHVFLPTPMGYSAWWPWVKNYHGELRVGAVRPGPIYSRIWIDQEMKEEMGY
ncbi:ABC transporter substrate-binding protein [uncultured Marinobacter sp.]|uniref:ABC transporter substrate-binding protein n=1 Tax=uncultured Marinobacter sp. TaxID=187379 RepID=UPI0030D73E8D